MTMPAIRYVTDSDRAEGLIVSLAHAIQLLDIGSRRLDRLKGFERDSSMTETELQPKTFLSGAMCSKAKEFREYIPFIAELVFCRAADNFLNYVSESDIGVLLEAQVQVVLEVELVPVVRVELDTKDQDRSESVRERMEESFHPSLACWAMFRVMSSFIFRCLKIVRAGEPDWLRTHQLS